MKIHYIRLLAIALSILSGTYAAQAQSGTKVLRKTIIGGEGGWDYLLADPETGRLYVSHSTQVEVLDLATHQKVGKIPGQGVHGIAVVPKSGRGVITNGRANTATIFDLKSLAVIAELSTGKNPDALLYDGFTDRVFVFNHSGGDVTVIDVAAAKVTGTLDLKGEGVEAGVSDGQGTIFVNLEDSHEIVSFDAKALTVKSRWKLTPGEEPTGLAMDQKNHRLFSACHNEMLIVLDSETGHVVATVPIGKGVDGAVYDSQRKIIATSNGEGTITIIKQLSADNYQVAETVKSQPGARTITLDPHSHHLYVTSAEYGERPAATKDNPEPRRPVVPNTFTLLEFGDR